MFYHSFRVSLRSSFDSRAPSSLRGAWNRHLDITPTTATTATTIFIAITSVVVIIIITSLKEVMFLPAVVSLFVDRITQKFTERF